MASCSAAVADFELSEMLLLKASETIQKHDAKDKQETEKRETEGKREKESGRFTSQMNLILLTIVSATIAVKAAMNSTPSGSVSTAGFASPPAPPPKSLPSKVYFVVKLVFTFLMFSAVTFVGHSVILGMISKDTLLYCSKQAATTIVAGWFLLTLYFASIALLSKPAVPDEWIMVAYFVVVNLAICCWELCRLYKKSEEKLPTVTNELPAAEGFCAKPSTRTRASFAERQPTPESQTVELADMGAAKIADKAAPTAADTAAPTVEEMEAKTAEETAEEIEANTAADTAA